MNRCDFLLFQDSGSLICSPAALRWLGYQLDLFRFPARPSYPNEKIIEILCEDVPSWAPLENLYHQFGFYKDSVALNLPSPTRFAWKK